MHRKLSGSGRELATGEIWKNLADGPGLEAKTLPNGNDNQGLFDSAIIPTSPLALGQIIKQLFLAIVIKRFYHTDSVIVFEQKKK